MTQLAVRGVDNVLFAVGDLDGAVRFYADRLGLPLVVRVDAAGIALFRLGAERPGLLVRAGTGDAGGRVWLETADARETARVLDAAGVAPGEPFQVATGWVVEVADPWGNVLGFTDYTLRPALARP
jgi:catechol 2,3-dioxygenase-like lactoylglutathione lyase family enzyme